MQLVVLSEEMDTLWNCIILYILFWSVAWKHRADLVGKKNTIRFLYCKSNTSGRSWSNIKGYSRKGKLTDYYSITVRFNTTATYNTFNFKNGDK